MRGRDFFIVILLWIFFGRGVDGETVTGVLHGQVELRGRYGQSPDAQSVQWIKYSTENLTKKLIYLIKKPNNTTCTEPCQNITFNLQNMSLILVHLTPEDEGIYEETTTFKNGTNKRFNVTLSLLFASNITVLSSTGSLTLKCEINGDFKLLRWFRNGLPLSDKERICLSENNKTMQVSNLSRSDCGTYSCQASNENGKSEAQVNVSGNISDVCLDNTSSKGAISSLTKNILFPVGLSLIGLLVFCIIFIYISRYYGRRKTKTTSIEEPVYNEPTPLQEEVASPAVDTLMVVYQDFIKPKDSHHPDQSEDFGYSTIAEFVENKQSPQTN